MLTGSGWDHLAARGCDPPRLFSAYLHTLRWNCVTATNPRLFQAPFRAGLRINAYQIEPVRKAESSQMASTVLGGFVKTEATAHGIHSGLRCLCLIVGGAGLLVTALLAWSKPARSP